MLHVAHKNKFVFSDTADIQDVPAHSVQMVLFTPKTLLPFLAYRTAAKQVARVLKPSGLYIVSAPHPLTPYARVWTDAVFDTDNYQGEIVLYHPRAEQRRRHTFFPRQNHDTLYVYRAPGSLIKATFHDDEMPSFQGRDFVPTPTNLTIAPQQAVYAPTHKRATSVWPLYRHTYAHEVDRQASRPPEILERLIAVFSSPGDVIVDLLPPDTALLKLGMHNRTFLLLRSSKAAAEFSARELETTLNQVLVRMS